MTLPILRLTPTATIPQRAEPGSVGYDLHADLGGDGGMTKLPPGQRAIISTGIACAIPPGCYGRIAPRSGLAAKNGIDVFAGVIDPSYRGELKAILFNADAGRVLTIQHGDRIAQLIIERCETPEVEEVTALPETARGASGFGSSGI